MSESSPDKTPERSELLVLTSDIVSAYAGNNALPSSDLPQLIETVYTTLSRMATPGTEPAVEQKPMVPPKKSVTNSALICLECGQSQKTLKRHLSAAHGMTPEEYKAKWNLGHDYPMVAPEYAAKRRELAKQIGLGRKAGSAAPRRAKKAKS